MVHNIKIGDDVGIPERDRKEQLGRIYMAHEFDILDPVSRVAKLKS